MASGSIEADERFANMIHRQQWQQKQEMNELVEAQSVSTAHAEFRRGLEELVRDHFHTCMTLASCSSAHESGINGRRDCIDVHHFDEDHDDGEEEEGDQLIRRRRRSNIEEDLAESSAARRRQSRILTRWAARQAQEMITTMERQNRESELLALAGLHTVSMLDSSFLRESSASRSERRVERPSTRASSLLQMWRELEEEQRADRARERLRASMAYSEAPNSTRERVDNGLYHENAGREGREHGSNNNNVNVSSNEVNRSRNVSENDSDHFEDREWTVNTRNNNENPEVGNRHEQYRVWEDAQLDSENASREQSPEPVEGDRERVRQIVQGWVTVNGITDNASNMTQGSGHRAEWLGENERERVRLVREWVHVTSQQRDARGNRLEQSHRHDVQPGLVRRQARQHEGLRDGLAAELDENEPEHVNRDALRLRGRQAILDLLVRIGRERQRELEGLLEHRAVSDFAHRNRLQSLLRGRFLRTGAAIEEERPPSTAARELGQLRQRRTVSGLRLESIVRGHAGNHSNGSGSSNSSSSGDSSSSRNDQSNVLGETQSNAQEEPQESNQSENTEDLERVTRAVVEEETQGDTEETRRDWPQNEVAVERGGVGWQEATAQAGDGNWQENIAEERVQEWQEHSEQDLHRGWQDPSENADGNWRGVSDQDVDRDWQGGASEDVGRNWHEGASQGARDWEEGPSEGGVRVWQGVASTRRVSNFQSSDDATANNMELRELLGRRSVSTVLASEFRENLDQLIRSYIQRQDGNPVPWDLQTAVQRPTTMQEQDPQEEEAEVQDEVLTNTPDERPLVPPPPPPPPPPPHPLWQQELHQPTWTRHPLQRSDVEFEVLNDLRTEMERLQQGMINMQRMLEACMDMQLELQRSVRQEVSAALNRTSQGQGVSEDSVDGSNWVTVRKGLCCVCCDSHIDSLLYRCGHMCTCLKCANELLHNSGKCPMCRAPIVEVVRAYCVM